MGIFWDAIRKPFRTFGKTSLVALFYMIPVVNFITHFFNSGYLLEVAKAAKEQTLPQLPQWKLFGRLFFHGIIYHVILILYFLVPIAVFIGLFLDTFSAIKDFDSFWTTLSSNPLQAGISLGTLLLFIYLIPIALVSYAQNKKFRDGFDVGKILKTAFTGRYFLYFIAAFLFKCGVAIIALYLMALTAITLVLPFVIFGYAASIIGLTLFSVFGNICQAKVSVISARKKS
ncbi:MAG: DUF4013 domain-containing protein [Candidatus Woesearchaeota archaeon]